MPEAKTPTLSPELRLAGAAVTLSRIVRHEPAVFAEAYRAQSRAFWSAFDAANRFGYFGSSFFADVVEIAARDVAAPDRAGARLEKLAHLRDMLALRLLQGGAIRRGLGALRPDGRFLGDMPDPGTNAAGPDVLTVERLQELAWALRREEPDTSARVEALLPLLQQDLEVWGEGGSQPGRAGARIGVLFHFASGNVRTHPGYGILAVARARAEIADRGAASRYALNGTITPPGSDFDRSMQLGREAANRVCRTGRGPDLGRGQVVHFDLEPLGQPAGESAGLAFGLLFASEARSACSRVALQPFPGTAATGRLDAEGVVHEVAEDSLRAKLLRIWESPVQRLVVPESQADFCREFFHEQRRGWNLGERDDLWVDRLPVVKSASHLEQVALPEHFSQRRRSAADWLRRTLRRHRLAVQASVMVLAAAAAAYGIFGFRHGIESVELRGDRLHVDYRFGRPQSKPLPPQRKAFVHAPGDSSLVYARWGDLDGRRGDDILIVSVEVDEVKNYQGAVRVDRLDDGLRPVWTRYVETSLAYRERTPYATDQLSGSIVLFQDLTGDGRDEAIVVANHLYFPSVLVAFDLDGETVLTYVNAGHIQDFCLVRDLEEQRALDAGREPARASGVEAGGPRGVLVLAHSQEDAGSVLAHLPPRMRAGALPAESARYQHATLPRAKGEFVRIPPSIAARKMPHQQAWPGSLDVLEQPRFQIKIATREIDPDGTLLRYFDAGLRPTRVEPTTAFLNRYREHAREGGFPPLDSEDFIASVESVKVWRDTAWVAERLPIWGR